MGTLRLFIIESKLSLGIPLFLSGFFYILFSASAVIKFYSQAFFLVIQILYSFSILIVGLGLLFSSICYFRFARRFANTLGYFCGIMAIFAGGGYTLIALSYFGVPTDVFFTIGLGITFVRTGLFFYAVFAIFFFFERPQGEIGAYGSILILAFGASYHLFVFSRIFLSAVLGSIFSILAGIGFIMQGIGLMRIGGKLRFAYPYENVRII